MGQQLNAQKGKSRTEALKEVSEEERRRRDVEGAAEVRTYN